MCMCVHAHTCMCVYNLAILAKGKYLFQMVPAEVPHITLGHISKLISILNVVEYTNGLIW